MCQERVLRVPQFEFGFRPILFAVGIRISLAKNNPGKLNYASQGSGATSHLTTEFFKSMAGGLRITHVPYKGTAPALADLLAGQVDMQVDNLGVSLPHVRSGKLKALAVASSRRFRSLPDVPALAETLLHPRSPRSGGERSGGAKTSAGAETLSDLSADPMGLTPAEAAAFMKHETERWGAVIRSAGVKLD